jgi:4-hydroxybenzoate polyprenyltransferase
MTLLGLKTDNLAAYAQLMRLDRPIGIFLVLWPTLCGLWLAAQGVPSLKNVVIFSLGALLMRSAGCVINDFADRNIDGKVKRTQSRPMATGKVSEPEALTLFVLITGLAFILVLFTNWMTIGLSVVGVALATSYPFMKPIRIFRR